MKKISPYLYIIKIKIMTSFIYRFEFFSSILASGIIMVSSIFLWKAVYHALPVVDGLTEKQMIIYAIISVLLSLVFKVMVERSMYERILRGDIAIEFIRPTHLLLCYLTEDIGMAISAIIMKFIPIFIIISLVSYSPFPVSFISLLLFIISSLFSFGILWIIEAIIGIMHMKYFELGNIGFVKDTVLIILSGSTIPIWFFPEGIRNVLAFFPFQYTYQTPLGIYIGKYSLQEALISMTIQALWLGLLFLLLIFLWNKFSKNVMVYGG